MLWFFIKAPADSAVLLVDPAFIFLVVTVLSQTSLTLTVNHMTARPTTGLPGFYVVAIRGCPWSDTLNRGIEGSYAVGPLEPLFVVLQHDAGRGNTGEL